jgi:hypothetical protein
MADGELVEFRRRLAARRAAGESFERAWRAELAALPPAHRWWEDGRRDYPARYALEAYRASWERAYRREPATALDLAGRRLAHVLEDAGGRGASRGPRHPSSEVLA